MRKSLFSLALLLCLMLDRPAFAGSAAMFGYDSPVADAAVDACRTEIRAIPVNIVDAWVRNDLRRLLDYSADELESYVPQAQSMIRQKRAMGDDEGVRILQLGLCFEEAIIRYKRGQLSHAPNRDAGLKPPALATAKPRASEPVDAGQAAAVAAIDQVLAIPPEKLVEKKGEDAKDCLRDEPVVPGKDAKIRNGCTYVVTFAWCTPGVDCRGNMFTHSWHLRPGETWVLDGSASGNLQMGACRGFNTIRLYSDPPYNYGCSAEPK